MAIETSATQQSRRPRHNPENNNPIDNGRENLHSIKGYTPLNLSDNIISDIVKPNIPDTIANIKQKSLHGRYFKELEQPEVRPLMHGLRNQIFTLRRRVLYLQYKIVL
jgi:hypothetical protein